MNAPLSLTKPLHVGQPQPSPEDDEINFSEYIDVIVDNRWLVAAITALIVLIGAAYATLASPVYQADLVVQVEDGSSAKSLLGDAASVFEAKTGASAEMEILRSRLVIGQAVDTSLLYILAKPNYLPLIGEWLAKRASGLSDPGFAGMRGYVSGKERIAVDVFEVPTALEGTTFKLTAVEDGHYVLSHPRIDGEIRGKTGALTTVTTPQGAVKLLVRELHGKPGAGFTVLRRSRLATVEDLQQRLRLAEKGRQSGVIEATLESADPQLLTVILNEIGRQYVRQNVERKAAEAQKTLAFLDAQLPQLKKQLDQAEDAYSRYRNQQGTVALDEEAKVILGRGVELGTKLLEAQQKRRELIGRFMPEHPVVRTLDEQIAAWNREIAALNDRARKLPSVQQDAVRLERDVRINGELYQQLRNNALQLQLVREGKTGNVRIIDEAVVPERPIKPARALVLALSVAVGLLLGVTAALVRSAMFRGIRDPQEIEAHSGMNVYGSIPLSALQGAISEKIARGSPGIHVLAQSAPHDSAVEGLRSLRTALQFATLDAGNNRILVTGATPGVGKSFISTNLAAVFAAAGKRVLLIDADMRKGYVHSYFGLSRGTGLSEVLAGQVSVTEVIHRAVMPDLDLLTTGAMPPNPAELLVRPTFAQMLDAVSADYDLVIVDTPPVLVASDTMSIAPHAATVLLVARADQTQLGELNESARRLRQVGTPVSGALFNAMDLSRRHYGSYGYRYGGYKYRQYKYESVQQN
ncbi:polysaccharide biosynthesis tyrosine autokinase [Ramlibacter tataouinensis]|uniref:polysaccharide biosynthesis tyrosine autokinase n=1 Tax=Ramlibacter tataouinensis TaxID=94132 RepID=UPI0022F3D892|nr:polysaccharide biosynthesis tyrosine autokinase [Ramlibacter tataouinensis]WBY02075.1 polysaccharide biosynthesis tyrosine autokinase [Ramlibacter tataouinensis]